MSCAVGSKCTSPEQNGYKVYFWFYLSKRTDWLCCPPRPQQGLDNLDRHSTRCSRPHWVGMATDPPPEASNSAPPLSTAVDANSTWWLNLFLWIWHNLKCCHITGSGSRMPGEFFICSINWFHRLGITAPGDLTLAGSKSHGPTTLFSWLTSFRNNSLSELHLLSQNPNSWIECVSIIIPKRSDHRRRRIYVRR